MKTPYGYLHFNLEIRGGWGLHISQLRTYRNKLLYSYVDMLTGLDQRGNKFDREENFMRYKNDYFLRHADPITIDRSRLCNALMPCFGWDRPDESVITHDSTNWKLSLQLDGRRVSFCYDTETNEFMALVNALEEIIQRPLL